MKVKFEAAIDLDERRRVWVTSEAVEVDGSSALHDLAQTTAEAAYHAYDMACERQGIGSKKPNEGALLRGMQED